MLKRIQCDEFKTFEGAVRPPIEFHKGLNAVIGTIFNRSVIIMTIKIGQESLSNTKAVGNFSYIFCIFKLYLIVDIVLGFSK